MRKDGKSCWNQQLQNKLEVSLKTLSYMVSLLPISIEYLILAVIIVIIGSYFLWQSIPYSVSNASLVILNAVGLLTGIVVWIGRRAKRKSAKKSMKTTDDAPFKNKLIGVIFVSVGFPLLVMGLLSYGVYQTQYDYVRARLADPNDSHTTMCGGGTYDAPFRCPLKLPTLSTSTILQIVEGGSLTITGSMINVMSYIRYIPKPLSVIEIPSTDGAPFK